MSDELLPKFEVSDVTKTRQGSFGVSDSGDTSGFGGLVSVQELAKAATRPFGGWFDTVADELAASLPDFDTQFTRAVEKVVIDAGEITFFIRASELVNTARCFRDEPGLRFEMCLGVHGVHYPHQTGRELHAVYMLRSITHNRLVRLEVATSDEHPHIPSLFGVYPAIDWHERETYDFFGIVFDGHPHLTRILMPDDWAGHPQRKDYPLGGIPIEFKGATAAPVHTRRSYN